MPDDYEQHWNQCKVVKGYASVAIFTKYKPVDVYHDIGVPEMDCEGRVLTMEFEKFIVVTTYTPNSGDVL